MREAPGTFQMAETEPPLPDLILLVKPEPKFRVFLQNFRDLFRRRELTQPLQSAPAAFWPDVFVDRGLPWRRFFQSGICHVLALALLWAGSRFLALQPHAVAEPIFNHADVIYYAPAEYLPPLDTRRATPAHARRADPEYSAQTIISVPPEATNRSQTIISAPNVQLQQDVALPNVVSLLEKIPADTRMPIGPAPAVPASEISRLAPPMERAVIAPPPSVDAGSTLRLGDLNIGHSAVIAPAPQLSLDEQRAPARNSPALSLQAGSAQVIAPPPALATSGHSRAGRSSAGMIALNLHPAVGAPPVAPPGNRRGSFAATPEGHRGASGAPGASVGGGKTDASGAGKNTGSLPSGLYVGADPAARNASTYSVNPNLIAGMRAPRLPARSLQSEGATKLSDEERAIFGDRKYYSLSLNMPNLNSAGGSWIIRFAALKPESDSASPSSSAAAGNRSSGNPSPGNPSSADASSSDLSAPAAKRKVDPAYPLELMRQNVSGTVILYAVIHADGTVGSVRVLRSVDERIDRFASDAIVKWQFQPATRNGAPVDVEATFWIPFHPARAQSNF